MAYTPMSTRARAAGCASAGTITPNVAANTVATEALAATAATQRRTPLRKPASDPKAVRTYAYGPPVLATLLPAAARHRRTRLMTPADATYATHADRPSRAAAMAGSAKIPAPTMRFTIDAAS